MKTEYVEGLYAVVARKDAMEAQMDFDTREEMQ